MNDRDAELVLNRLNDLSMAAWRQVQEQEETNRLLRILCDANGARADEAQVPKAEGKP